MAERARPIPLLDTFRFSAAYSCVEANGLAAADLAERIASNPLPRTSRTHPDRGDLSISAPSPVGLMVHSARAARRPANWVRKLQALHAALDKPLAEADAVLLPGPSPMQDHGSMETAPMLMRQGLRLIIPFSRPGDFGKLMAAVRVALPLLPAYSASTPFAGGTATGTRSTRLQRWTEASAGHPERSGAFIPEPHFDRADHDREVLGPIMQGFARNGDDPGLDPQDLDWRAATVLSEPDAIAIHAIDMQENPAADMAVLEFTLAVLRALCSGRWVSSYLQRAWDSDDLGAIMRSTIAEGSGALITNRDYLLMFGLMKQEELTAAKLVQHLFVELYGDLSENARTRIALILEHGELGARLQDHAGARPSAEHIAATARALAYCRTGASFRPPER
jgi:hypothetical protein